MMSTKVDKFSMSVILGYGRGDLSQPNVKSKENSEVNYGYGVG